MEDADVRLIVTSIMKSFEDRELKQKAKELRETNRLICSTNKAINDMYIKLNASHTLDIRYLCLAACLLEIKNKNIYGDFAELGVYRGTFAKRIHALCPDRHFYLLDTFSGFDQEQFNHDMNTYELKNKGLDGKRFNDTSVEIVKKSIGGNNDFIHPIPGVFPDTATNIKNKKFAFVSLDADLYQAMKDGIEFFYPRLVPGGYIMVHDFHNQNYPGTHAAIFEYVQREHISYIPIPDNCGSVIISKPL